MAALDFNGLCSVRRTDEIGVLADSLNDLSRGKTIVRLVGAYRAQIRSCKLIIDMERQLERQR